MNFGKFSIIGYNIDTKKFSLKIYDVIALEIHVGKGWIDYGT